MAYQAGALSLMSEGITGSPTRLFGYSTADTPAVVLGAGYFAGVGSDGIRAGDFVLVNGVAADGTTQRSYMVEVFSISGDAATVRMIEGGNERAPANVTIGLAAGITNQMVATITVQDMAGNTIAGVHALELWISSLATGLNKWTPGENYTSFTVTGGFELQEITDGVHYKILTAATGIATFAIVHTDDPATAYVAVKHPVTSRVIVSAASGTNWGA